MNIGEAAREAGISAKMIRYYEAIGLVPPVGRTRGGYRDYNHADVRRLHFIRRARDLGFPLARVRELLKLWGDRRRSRGDVKVLALDHIAELETRAAALQQMIRMLRQLADSCDGGDHPDCRILEELESSCAACGALLGEPSAGTRRV